MKLTDIVVRSAKPGLRPVKLSDGKGLHLLIQPNGAKLWRFSYRFGGKQRTVSLGVYVSAGSNTVEMALSEARKAHTAARRQLREGIDPSQARRASKVAEAAEGRSGWQRKWLRRAEALKRERRPNGCFAF